MNGTLYVCATPIGNLEDITLRVLRILEEVDYIAAEDTRHTLKLINHYEIKTSLVSYHEHNKIEKGAKIAEDIKNGKNVALVTDAGMPGISDPGEDLIRICHEEGVNVTVAPGATAAITALVLSGLSSRAYCFEAFLPSNKKYRKYVLERLKTETRTTVIYEAPHHLLATLKELYAEIGDRKSAVIKELTKKHETVNSGNLSNLIKYFEEYQPKGEFVIVISGISKEKLVEETIENYKSLSIEEHMELYKHMDEKSAMKQVSKDRGIRKNEVYNYLKKG